MVIFHVLIAFAGIVTSTVSAFRPSKAILTSSYGFIVATILSGVALVVVEPGRMVHVCVAGLMYVTVASTLTIIGKIRLTKRREGQAEA